MVSGSIRAHFTQSLSETISLTFDDNQCVYRHFSGRILCSDLIFPTILWRSLRNLQRCHSTIVQCPVLRVTSQLSSIPIPCDFRLRRPNDITFQDNDVTTTVDFAFRFCKEHRYDVTFAWAFCSWQICYSHIAASDVKLCKKILIFV